MPNPQSHAQASRLVGELRPRAFLPVLEDMGIAPERVRTLENADSATHERGQNGLLGLPATGLGARALVDATLAFGEREVSSDGALLLFAPRGCQERELPELRNALWPTWHLTAVYRTSHRGVERSTPSEQRTIPRAVGMNGILLVFHRRAAVMAPEAIATKFDKNSAGWNGAPGTPGYAHFRWMRQFVGTFAPVRGVRRVLDFGCGAGWVGIEAALAARAADPAAEPELCAFDPSPEMVKLAEENARASGLTRFSGRTGFGEAPPFPGPGEARFDLVISSGVLSFSPDSERWFDGLVATLARGGTLVIGDINRVARGMQKRRAARLLIPVRELNAWTRDEARAALEKRGLVFEAWCGYQLSDPLPQLMHLCEHKLGGFGFGTLLAWNRRASRRDAESNGSGASERFDSWVMRLRAPS